MAREIIVYDAQTAGGGTILFYAFWLAVPASLQASYVNPDFVSAVPLASAVSWGVTSAELTALQNGTVTEVTDHGGLPAGVTASQVGAFLTAAYTTAQTTLNNQAPAKNYAGAYYDSVAGWQNVPA